MERKNKIHEITKSFAIRIIRLYQYLCEHHKEYVLSKQILRCGTSIGANVRESINAQSREDFIHKLNIALKEANETEYWLELLFLTNYIDQQQYDSMIEDNKHITGTLVKIIKSTKINNIK